MSRIAQKRGRPARRMTPAEIEFDVTDDVQVSALLAGHDGPVRSGGLNMVEQLEIPSFVSSLGSLSVRRS